MKRIWFVSLMIVVVAVLGIVSVVGAQDPTPATPGQGFGRGMMGRGGMMGGAYGQGAMHDYMEKIVAEKLGVTVEELEALHADGKTFWQIAEDKGLSVEEAQQVMVDARSQALDAMVKDNVITQEQADAMKSRMGGGFSGGRGGCGMGGGRWNNNSAAPRGTSGARW
jgi:hypothetical protein